MRVSLCVICGNESHHIEAMLEAFAPAFDEFSLVRAIGKREPDDTVIKAEQWCRKNAKDFVFAEHINEPTANDWDHVDSFARARNASFRQATGDWLFWADCDDISRGAEHLREVLEGLPPAVKMARFTYDVKGSGKCLYRERAIRRESFHAGRVWHHDVHENLLILDGDKHLDLDTVVWVHAPREVKRENRRRNLRILANSVRECATQYFYIHQEHYCNQSREPALEFGKLALQFPNLQPPFRYEALINCARLTHSSREAKTLLLEAHGVFPWCREALVGLVLHAFERKEYAMAVWWAGKMMELREPLPDKRPWTHEAKWYGWAGYDVAARAYRAEGNKAMATVLQAQFHAGLTPRISLLHATRNRSSMAVSTRDAWLNAASDPTRIEHIFAVDSDDGVSVEMAKQFVSVISPAKSCVTAWNLAAAKAQGDILVQLSDDWVPCLDWDGKLLRAVEGRDPRTEQFVIAPSDGTRKDDLLCMAILSRARYEKQGHLFFEGYESVFSDNEFTHRAHKDGVVVDAREVLRFEHRHPAFGKGKMDETYAHNNTTDRYKRGEALFKERNP
jgi:glycosyltransferase involved in cell wall biosynthesis